MQTLASLSPTNFLCQETQTAKHRRVGYFSERASFWGAGPAGRRPEAKTRNQLKKKKKSTSGQGLLAVSQASGWLLCFILDGLPIKMTGRLL